MLGTSFLLPNYLQVALLCEFMLVGYLFLKKINKNKVESLS